MEKNKFCFERLLAFATVVLSCVYMWGCSDTTFEWDEKRSGAKVMGFVDDSLVMVEDYRCWSKYTNYANGSSDDDRGCENARLCVYNYRVQEDGPRWCDSLTGSYTNGMWDGQFSDSVIWGHLNVQRENSISLWKIGEKPHKISLNRSLEGCSIVFRGNSVKEWVDGAFIVRNEKSLKFGGDSCQYAVLDTLLKTITYKRLEKNLEWIKECDDVRAWGNDVVCLKRRGNELLNLWVNNEGKDSIYVRDIPFWDSMTISLASLSFYGKLFYWAYVNSIDHDKWKIKLNPNVRPLSFPSFGEFVDEKKKLISY
ncbi:MAG: hypothetical protein IJM92_15500 [Fibrobacter sp.]|uniref:hypothetical protein n=1 Tax=Fibrobacter sp. TaxID=35828 RepID=UPI0025B8AB33|nr:hypothetical protein [Fibrobacter sp.]MBQ7081027.1 hypothetical protein [Fibrobacter sp.]